MSPIVVYVPVVMQNVAKYRTWLFDGTARSRLITHTCQPINQSIWSSKTQELVNIGIRELEI